MTAAIDITAGQRKTLLALLRRYIPGVAVWAYGSRVKWTARPNSDLDLVAFTTPEQQPRVSELKEALAESDLPFLVDFHVWDDVPERFHEIIRKEYVVFQDVTENTGVNNSPGDYAQHKVEELISDGVLLINDGYRAKNSELSKTGIPFARVGNIDGGFHFEDADRVPPETLSRVGLKRSLPGDVVFTSKGTVGRFAFVREHTPEFVYSPQLCYWRASDPARIHPRWLYYWMNGREFFLQYKGVAGQTDMAEYVSLRDQRAMKITLPPPDEQKAIAHILGTLDDKIELNRRMNATLEEMARELFQSWFVDFDPVRAKLDGRQPAGLDAATAALFPAHFQESPLGHIPQGWAVRSLDQVADYLNGLALQKYPPGDGETLPVIKIAQLRKGDSEGADRCNTELAPQYIVDDGDVLFSWSGSLEVELWCGGRGALNQHLFKVTSSDFP